MLEGREGGAGVAGKCWSVEERSSKGRASVLDGEVYRVREGHGRTRKKEVMCGGNPHVTQPLTRGSSAV